MWFEIGYMLPQTKSQDGKPFVLSGRSYYYIGFTDLKPEGLGYHIKNEMNGLWFPPIRVLKWITLERNGKMMIPEAVIRDYTSVKFEFVEMALKFLVADGNSFLVELERDKWNIEPVEIVLELGIMPVWFSDRDTDFSISKKDSSIVIIEKNFGRRVIISSEGSKAVRYDRNRITFKTENSMIIQIKVMENESGKITSKNIKKEAEDYRSQFMRSMGNKTAISGNTKIAEYFNLAVLNLMWMALDMKDVGSGIVAGYPDFPWLFGIDTYYSSKGLLISGMNEEYENTLKVLEKYGRNQDGRIPHEIVSNGKVYNKGNRVETIAYPAMVWNLYEYTGKTEKVKEREGLFMSSLSPALLHEVKGTGIMEDPDAGEGTDIDTICNYIESLNSLLKINSVIESGRIDEREIKKEIDEKITFLRNEMWMEEIGGFADRYRDGIPQFNGFWTSVLPFSFNFAHTNQYKKFLNESGEAYSKLITSDGIKVDQNGNVMPNGNSMFVKGSLNYNDVRTAMKFLYMNMSSIGKYSNYCFPEIINNSSGCFMQAWSAALFIENIIHDFLGIHPDGRKLDVYNRFTIPEEFEGIRVNGMKYRDSLYNFEVKSGKCISVP